MIAQQKNFLGIPVKGNIQSVDKRVPQLPIEDLALLMQVVLDDPTVTWFGWTQYTPYFNDGEPCIFSVHSGLAVGVQDPSASPVVTNKDGFGALTQESDDDDDDDNDDEEYDDASEGVEYNEFLGKRISSYDSEVKDYPAGAYLGPDEARYDRCLVLEKAITSGAFDSVLLEHFGDHCTVRVTRNGIKVMEYSHD